MKIHDLKHLQNADVEGQDALRDDTGYQQPIPDMLT